MRKPIIIIIPLVFLLGLVCGYKIRQEECKPRIEYRDFLEIGLSFKEHKERLNTYANTMRDSDREDWLREYARSIGYEAINKEAYYERQKQDAERNLKKRLELERMSHFQWQSGFKKGYAIGMENCK
jgi:hypothetical protein